MIVLSFNSNGIETSQNICPEMFGQNGNSIVKIICNKPWYGEIQCFQNSICSYLSSFMQNKFEVKTNHENFFQSTGIDQRGKFILEITFQIFLVNKD